ncbi:MAG: VOC family protein [candidate division Zixibacteria bacterium]|nr:VOC family protein [candidate division Zixibacteria bacterium]
MPSKQRIIKGLAEIALRVNDLDKMTRFYEEVIGLELLESFEKTVFFRIAEGVEGHMQVLALFDRSGTKGYTGIDSKKSTIDHIAFGISKLDYEPEKKRIEALGYEVRTAYHEWVKWRSLYVTDPEGNTVEMVCYDASL